MDCDMTILLVMPFYLKRWEKRGYAAEFADFIVGEEGNQWLAKPHNFQQVQDSIKNLPRT
jgi:iron complex outermembrane receptor protein